MKDIIKKYHPLDFDKDIAIGIKLPFSTTKSTYTNTIDYVSGSVVRAGSISLFEKTYTTGDQLLYNLTNLVLTIKGERVMHPNFGTDVYSYLFEPIDLTVISDLRTSLIKDIKYWMPFIILGDIDINIDKVDQNTFKISIPFKANEFDEERTLEFGFGETITYQLKT